jgi:hypothetical protein
VTSGINRFYNSIEGATELSASDLISFFTYYLIVEAGGDVATATAIDRCFRDCDLAEPRNTSAFLSKGLKGPSPKFVKANGGYRLHRNHREDLATRLGTHKAALQTSSVLRKLEARITAAAEKGFLTETLDCFEIGANRATITMCWILTIDHLCEYVLKSHVAAFNSELAKVTDRRVKVTKIQSRDDFADIPEVKFIELLRAAGIISNDVRKILEEKLGIRNSCAHPSGVSIKPSKVVEFVDDLVENIVLKYSILATASA